MASLIGNQNVAFLLVRKALDGNVGMGHLGGVGAMSTANKPSHTECRAVSELRRTNWKYVQSLLKMVEKGDFDTLCTCMEHTHTSHSTSNFSMQSHCIAHIR